MSTKKALLVTLVFVIFVLTFDYVWRVVLDWPIILPAE